MAFCQADNPNMDFKPSSSDERMTCIGPKNPSIFPRNIPPFSGAFTYIQFRYFPPLYPTPGNEIGFSL